MQVFQEKGKPEYPGENLSEQRENQQTQPTYDAESENRTRATLVGGECSHHYIYWQYIDDTLTAMPDVAGAESCLSTLNECHPSISFTLELVSQNKLPFLGMEITKNGSQPSTSVYFTENLQMLAYFYSCQSGNYSGQAYFTS